MDFAHLIVFCAIFVYFYGRFIKNDYLCNVFEKRAVRSPVNSVKR